MKRLLATMLGAALLACGLAYAQPSAPPVTTLPSPRSATIASSTIAVTNTFQQIYTSNNNRTGCTIQNTGTNPMYVFFGATGSATIATSVKLVAGQAVYCTSGDGIALTNAVQITGTATETFYAASW